MQPSSNGSVQFGAHQMLAAWARSDYQSISDMRRSFRFAADIQEKNEGTVERLELLDQIGSALAESGPAARVSSASDKERLCAYLGLLHHIGRSPC